jgi:peptidoglycan hydrolase-like protein with peptidoglycan-binding domain
MTYLYGHHSEEIREMQAALLALNLYAGDVDGDFGPMTLEAVKKAQELYRTANRDGVVTKELLDHLGIAPKPPPTPTASNPISDALNLIRLIGQIKSFVKGLQMDSSANVDVKSSWLSTKNWAAAISILTSIAAFFHIVIPPDLGPTVIEFVGAATGLYILVKNTWFSSTITTASAKNAGKV